MALDRSRNSGHGKQDYDARKRHKEAERKASRRKIQLKHVGALTGRRLLYAALPLALAAAAVWWWTSGLSLPPTDMEGHIESSPPSHILTVPMAEVVQRHMLEHADGRGPPGVIIQYNCADYDCEPDLIQKLTKIVLDHGANVYLAPGSYDGKIILTKLNRRKILEDFDDAAIRRFIVR